MIGQVAAPRIDLQPILPELALAAAGIVGVLYEALARRPDRRVHLIVALAGVAGSAVALLSLWGWSGDPFVLAGSMAVDRLSVIAGLILMAVAAIGLIYGEQADEQGEPMKGEFFPLVVFATLGMVLIAAAADLIMVFLALEILSLSLYVLTGITGRRGTNEAAMKYFLLGAFSSAFFLYGVAMAYGATDSTRIADVVSSLAGGGGALALALAAFALLVIGFAFKVSAAPFHMWTPDVYQGAPTAVTDFMSAATKVAAFAALMRVLMVAFQPLTWDWTPVIWALAAVSVVVGSVLAVAQTDIKRMLAYSSVAHAGFILTGLTAPGATGMSAALFYLLVYAAMTIGAFGVVMLVRWGGQERTAIAAYAGLWRRRPALAVAMAVFLLSLAGIPPTAGFIAKVNVFAAATGAGHWALVVIGVLASVVAAFFYLRVIVLMFMREPESAEPMEPSRVVAAVVAVPAVLLLVLGVVPGIVTGLMDQAAVLRW